jgi:hypothetical protein
MAKKPDVTVWPAGEFATINAARIAGKADNEIRDLVARLEAVRKECLRRAPGSTWRPFAV